jgi:DNA-binding MarR family transcriptional regulator
MGSFGRLFFKEKQIKAFLALASSQQEWNISNLAKLTGITYVHLSRFINECEKAGLIESDKHGRIKGIRLTQKGAEVASHISSIENMINVQEAKIEENKVERAGKENSQ